MKKQVTLALAAAFTLSVTGTVLAAPANSFGDVPAKHWSYDALTKLSQAGIVSGYSDGTFRGDKTLTRYEMAQIVANALTKSEQATAEQKAIIDKLSAEYSTELQSLGVRLEKVEKTQQDFKFSGDSRIRFLRSGDGVLKNSGTKPDDVFQERIRLNIKAKVSDDVTANVRYTAQNTSADQGSSSAEAQLGLANFVFKEFAGLKNFTIGRFNPTINGSDATQLVFSPGSIGNDGAGFTFGGGKLSGNYNYFDIAQYAGKNPDKLPPKGIDYLGSKAKKNPAAYYVNNLNLRYALNDKTTIDLAGMYSTKSKYPKQLGSVGVTHSVDKWILTFEAVQNFKDKDADGKDLPDRKGWIANVQYGNADRNKPGTWDISASYQKIGANAIDWDVTGPDGGNMGPDYGTKGWHFNVDYTVSKNSIFYLSYDPEFSGYSDSSKKCEEIINTGFLFWF